MPPSYQPRRTVTCLLQCWTLKTDPVIGALWQDFGSSALLSERAERDELAMLTQDKPCGRHTCATVNLEAAGGEASRVSKSKMEIR